MQRYSMYSQMPLGFFIYWVRGCNRVSTSVAKSSEWHVSSSNLARKETL
jgi:hypothetical protein